MSRSDAELLDDYVRRGSEAAFGELVGRYIDLVHASAVRQLPEAHLADDVTQATFILLAKKAGKIRGDYLAGWLLNATRYCVADARRKAVRRHYHEHQAAAMRNTFVQEPNSPKEEIFHYLDEAIGCLPPRQSTAISMRYLQNKSTAEVASAMGVSQDAVQKIIQRALPKLRRVLAGRGLILSGMSGLTEAMVAASKHSAPPHLAALVGKGAPSSVEIAKGAMRIIFWNKAQVAIIAAATGLALSGGTALVVMNRGESVGAKTVSPQPLSVSNDEKPFASPFLELERCRIKQKIHLTISVPSPSATPAIKNPSLLAAANPRVMVFEKEALEIGWDVTDPSIARHADHYLVSLASESDGTTNDIHAPVERSSGQEDVPAFRMEVTVPDPGNYYVHVRACDAAGNVIGQSSLPLLVQPLIRTDIEISDIKADGRVLCYGVLQKLNDTDVAIKQDSISNSGDVRVSIRDEKGRPLAITEKPEGRGVRYTYTFNEPVQPGQWEFMAGNAETKAPMARKIGQDGWEYSATYGGSDQAMRRLILLRLPPGAEFVSAKTVGLQHMMVDGREQIFLDSMLKENENVVISFRYHLARL